MPDYDVVTNEASINVANEIAKAIADSVASPAVVGKLRLFDSSLVPDQDTTEADFVAAETALVGYPVGGYDLTAFAAPLLVPGGGAAALSNLITVVYASGAAVSIGGYWIESAGNDVLAPAHVFDPPRNLAVVGDGFPIVVQLNYGRTSV